MTSSRKTWLIRGAIAAAVLFALYLGWQMLDGDELPDGIISGNGRIEAVEIDVSAKIPGRVDAILVDEGEFVEAGQIVARMDTETLLAQKAEAEARLAQAVNGIQIAQSQVAQQLSNRAAVTAMVRQREAELVAARGRLVRSTTLADEGATSMQERDDNAAQAESAAAAVEAAQAQVSAVDAAIQTARSQIGAARAQVDAARATVARIDAEIGDSTLRTPTDGRVQYLVAQSGEVIGGGGRVLNLVNLGDVYMTLFLPETVAGRVALGTEVRIVLDAAPEMVVPARVSFVADVAQFTPKTVETADERQKLMFRVRAQIDPELLQRNLAQVKTGLPGVAYVRVDKATPWPDELAVNVPQ